MFKLKIPSLGIVGREIKALTSVFSSSKQNSNKSNAWDKEVIYYTADNRKRKRYIECYTTMIYSLCYEYREDGTIRVI